MATFSVAALYMLGSALADLAAFREAVMEAAPVLVVATGDVAVIPGAVVVLSFAALEIARPSERNRRLLTGLALGCFLLTAASPVIVRRVARAWMNGQGYDRCPERVVGYTLPAERYSRDPRLCKSA